MDENRDPLDRCGDRSCGGIFWCWSGLDVKHSWTTSGDRITVTTEMPEKNTGDDLGIGFNLSSGYKFTSVSANASSPELLLQTDTDSQQGSCLTGIKFYGINSGAVAGAWISWTLDMEYCGDGECNCGETCTNCQTDCGSCDTTPPTTSIKCNGTTCSTGWYNTDIAVTLTCGDGTGSGCDKTYYCTTGASCTPTTEYTGAFNIITEGTNYVRYYSKDKATPVNTESFKPQTIKLDKIPPTTEIK